MMEFIKQKHNLQCKCVTAIQGHPRQQGLQLSIDDQ